MKRYFDIHDQQITAELNIIDDSQASKASVDKFKEYFNSDDVREITLSQYKRLREQYSK